MMMRQGGPNKNQNQRGRGGGGGNRNGGYQGGGQQRRPNGGGGSPNRMASFDSNGPDVRIRGNAYQVHEKYLALARDASVAGDRVLVESYYQHAEHYYRIINAENYGPNGERRQDAYNRVPDNGQEQEFGEGDGQNEGGEPGEQGYREERAEGYRENRPDNRPDSRRERGDNRGNRQEGNYRRERQPNDPERQYQERPFPERQNLAEQPQPDLSVIGAINRVEENEGAQPGGDEQTPPEATVERRRRHPRQVPPDETGQDVGEQPEV